MLADTFREVVVLVPVGFCLIRNAYNDYGKNGSVKREGQRVVQIRDVFGFV